LQMVSAANVFANEGEWVPPFIVDHVLDKNGNKLMKIVDAEDKVIHKFGAGVRNPVVEPPVAELLKKYLISVTHKGGTAKRAAIKGYQVAGKTGTAEMVIDGQYSKDGAKRTYFVGYSPAEKPKYIMAVRLDYPKKCFVSWDPTLRNRCEGSNSASMAFQKAMQRILINDPEISSQAEG